VAGHLVAFKVYQTRGFFEAPPSRLIEPTPIPRLIPGLSLPSPRKTPYQGKNFFYFFLLRPAWTDALALLSCLLPRPPPIFLSRAREFRRSLLRLRVARFFVLSPFLLEDNPCRNRPVLQLSAETPALSTSPKSPSTDGSIDSPLLLLPDAPAPPLLTTHTRFYIGTSHLSTSFVKVFFPFSHCPPYPPFSEDFQVLMTLKVEGLQSLFGDSSSPPP